MALINIQTNLKSLKYGRDRIGGGSSNQPYITKPIPNGEESLGRTGGPDFIIRGGTLAITSTADDVSRLTKMFFDTKSFNGFGFIAKQNLLSRTGVKTQAGGQEVYLPTSTLAQAGVSAAGLHFYKQGLNPIPLPTNGSIISLGPLGAISSNGNIISYSQIVKPGNTVADVDIPTNRLFQLYENKILGIPVLRNSNITNPSDTVNIFKYGGGPGSILGIGPTYIKFADQRTGINNVYGKDIVIGKYQTQRWNGRTVNSFTSQLFVTPLQQIYNNQKGKYGDLTTLLITGSTFDPSFNINVYKSGTLELDPEKISPDTWTPNQTIERSLANNNFDVYNININDVPRGFRTPEESLLWVEDPNSTNTPPSNTIVYTQNQLSAASEFNKATKYTPGIQDFRAKLKKSIMTPKAPNYSEMNIEKRVHLGDPGSKSRKKTNYDFSVGSTPWNNALDKITAMPIYQSNAVTSDNVKNDLVKFRIAIIDNDNPSQKIFIHFRAFLDSFSDAYTANWNGSRLLGRGEEFYTYGGFTREVSMGWTMAAQSKQELIPIYQKLNYLASTLTPDFNKTTGYMRGNIAQLTVGGYLYEQPGIIKGLTYTIEESTPWEIGIDTNGNSDKDVKELPHVIKVTGFSFTPIHEFIPRKQDNVYDGEIGNRKNTVSNWGPERYIALSTGTGKDTNNYDYAPTYIPWKERPIETIPPIPNDPPVEPPPTPKPNPTPTPGPGPGPSPKPRKKPKFPGANFDRILQDNTYVAKQNIFAKKKESEGIEFLDGDFGGGGSGGPWDEQ